MEKFGLFWDATGYCLLHEVGNMRTETDFCAGKDILNRKKGQDMRRMNF
jgi:hypothetical protein